MAAKYVYHREELQEDTLFLIAQELFETRTEKRISLAEASRLTDIPLLQIDAMECMADNIDFRCLSRLLDLYSLRLDFVSDAFPCLPKAYRSKYFLS